VLDGCEPTPGRTSRGSARPRRDEAIRGMAPVVDVALATRRVGERVSRHGYRAALAIMTASAIPGLELGVQALVAHTSSSTAAAAPTQDCSTSEPSTLPTVLGPSPTTRFCCHLAGRLPRCWPKRCGWRRTPGTWEPHGNGTGGWRDARHTVGKRLDSPDAGERRSPAWIRRGVPGVHGDAFAATAGLAAGGCRSASSAAGRCRSAGHAAGRARSVHCTAGHPPRLPGCGAAQSSDPPAFRLNLP
jgi:hypothetical protein